MRSEGQIDVDKLTPEELSAVPCRGVKLGSRAADIARRSDGSVVIRLKEELKPFQRRLTDALVHWAQYADPRRTFLAQRDGAGWQRLTFSETLQRVRRVAQALLDRGLGPGRPVMILSGNDLDNAVLALACLHVGVIYIPVTPAYSLLSKDFAELRKRVAFCEPQLIFASDGERYAQVAAQVFPDVELVVSRHPPVDRPATLFSELLATHPTPRVDKAYEAVTPDTIGKVMFTSGTTGAPKGVMYSQRMLCANRQQGLQHLAFLSEAPSVQVDWLPWHHTFGGTSNFGLALYSGGSLYIDPGQPTPDQIHETVRTLTEISPTLYQGTPQALGLLLPHLRSNRAFRESFYRDLKLIYYGGATMPRYVWDELDRIAIMETGQRILIASGIGSTETGPMALGVNWDPMRQPVVGLPVPGSEMKVAPVGNKLELRVRGPNVSPGYWKDAELSRAALDEEGFFKLGDAVRFLDPTQPELGVIFDGRIAEQFKLTSGTWVNVAELRETLLAACAPYLSEVVITGHDRDYCAALLFPHLDRLKQLVPASPALSAEQLVEHPQVIAYFQTALDTFASAPASKRVAKALLEPLPPQMDKGEISAKMAISQAAVLTQRAGSVDLLYSTERPARLVTLSDRP